MWAAGRGGARQAEVHNQKQQPHTKMWGTRCRNHSKPLSQYSIRQASVSADHVGPEPRASASARAVRRGN